MQEEKPTQDGRIIDKLPYQVFVVGKTDEQEGEQFILTPPEASADMVERGLGRTPYLNLRLIQKFSSADNGNFGGDSTYEQLTMFQNDSPVHFSQLAAAILKKAYGKDDKGKSTEPKWVDNKGEEFPVIKLNGVFEGSHIESKRVKEAYMVFKAGDGYELQMTDHKIGGEWDSYPSVISVITKFFGGNDANAVNIDKVMRREEDRKYIKAFNCVEIDALAAKEGVNKNTFKEWLESIAEERVRASLDRARLMEEDSASATSKEALAKENATIKEGAETGQPAADVKATEVKATGTDDGETV